MQRERKKRLPLLFNFPFRFFFILNKIQSLRAFKFPRGREPSGQVNQVRLQGGGWNTLQAQIRPRANLVHILLPQYDTITYYLTWPEPGSPLDFFPLSCPIISVIKLSWFSIQNVLQICFHKAALIWVLFSFMWIIVTAHQLVFYIPNLALFPSPYPIYSPHHCHSLYSQNENPTEGFCALNPSETLQCLQEMSKLHQMKFNPYFLLQTHPTPILQPPNFTGPPPTLWMCHAALHDTKHSFIIKYVFMHLSSYQGHDFLDEIVPVSAAGGGLSTKGRRPEVAWDWTKRAQEEKNFLFTTLTNAVYALREQSRHIWAITKVAYRALRWRLHASQYTP